MSTIDGVSSLYTSNYDTTTQTNSTSGLEGTLNSDLSTATDDELMDVCKEFESYFVEQMFKEMKKTVPETEDSSDSSTASMVDYYNDEMTKEYSSMATESGSLGLAQTLYDQMKRNYNL